MNFFPEWRDYIPHSIFLVTEAMGQGMVACSAAFPAEVSEFEACGFTAVDCERVRAPRVAESPLAMECRLLQTLEVGAIPTTLVLAEVLRMHVDDAVLAEDGLPDPSRLAPLGRLGRQHYAGLAEVAEIPRPAPPGR